MLNDTKKLTIAINRRKMIQKMLTTFTEVLYFLTKPFEIIQIYYNSILTSSTSILHPVTILYYSTFHKI